MAIDDSNNNSNSSKRMSALLTNSSATFFGGGSTTAKTTMTAEEFIAEFGERIKKEVTEPVGKAVSFSNKPDSLQTRTSPNRNLEAKVTVTNLNKNIAGALGTAVQKTATETITKTANEDKTALNSSPKI